MKFSAQREVLLKPLQQVVGIVERKQTNPILSNLLVNVSGTSVTFTGTDSELELVVHLPWVQVEEAGEITLPAKKLLDICRSLPIESDVVISGEDNRALIQAHQSRFVLSSLPAVDFPNLKTISSTIEIQLSQKKLKRLLETTAFSMAQQDVRYFLNGILLEVSGNRLRSIATDGHRLSLSDEILEKEFTDLTQVIVPRKGVMELIRLLEDTDQLVTLALSNAHIRLHMDHMIFTSKLIDGQFPDYEKVIPKSSQQVFIGERESLKHALSRVAILSNEKYKGVRLQLSDGNLILTANNPEQEEAEERLEIDYRGETFEVGFNVNYLLDILQILTVPYVKISFANINSSAVIRGVDDDQAVYVVMPMKL